MHALGNATAEATFGDLAWTLQVLRTIARDELAGQPLSADERRWMSMVVEILPPSSDGPGSQDGWYFHMFPSDANAFEDPGFIADYYTSTNMQTVVYAGATEPRLGVFVVDAGGPPRVVVGPVARGFEARTPTDHVLTDAESKSPPGLSEPWAKRYTAASPPEPPLSLMQGASADGSTVVYDAKSTRPLGVVTLEQLDHHRVVVARGSAWVGARVVPIALTPLPGKEQADTWGGALRAIVGGYSMTWTTNDAMTLGGMAPLTYEDITPPAPR